MLRGPLDRESLALDVVHLPSPAERLAWLAETMPKLPGTGIVYTLTVEDARRVTDWLRGHGIDARAYFGDETTEAKVEIERQLQTNELKCVVATSALGMGYDKPNLAFVVHFQVPGSAVAYYQQVGRAGRAIDQAFGIALVRPRRPPDPGLVHQHRVPDARARRAGRRRSIVGARRLGEARRDRARR